VTLAEYLPTVTAAATDSSTHVYAPYWGCWLRDYRHLCLRLPAYLGAFGKVVTVDKKVRPSPCPCVTGGCDCPTKFFKREGQSCDDRYAGLGDTELRSVTKADIATAMAWSERKAVKHWAYRNIRRAQNGRTCTRTTVATPRNTYAKPPAPSSDRRRMTRVPVCAPTWR